MSAVHRHCADSVRKSWRKPVTQVIVSPLRLVVGNGLWLLDGLVYPATVAV